MKDAIILFGGVFIVGLPFIIMGCVISWREQIYERRYYFIWRSIYSRSPLYNNGMCYLMA